MLALAVVVLGLASLAGAAPTDAQLAIATPDGSASLRFGLLAETQAEWREDASGEATARSLLLRRLRVLLSLVATPVAYALLVRGRARHS